MKEKIKVIDLAKNAKYPNDNNLCPDDWDTCRIISDTIIDADSEKGYTTQRVIIKRKSDGKFFMFKYSKSYDWDDLKDQTATEVEEKQKIITYYE